MKLLDGQNTKDANYLADSETNKSTSCNEAKIVKMSVEVKDSRKILCDGLIQNRKICYDDLSKKGIKNGDREDKDEINVNINKEERKLMRQLTQELAQLRVKEVDGCGDKPELFNKSDLLVAEKKPNERSVDGIIAGMKEMVLEKGLKEKQTDDDDDVAVIGKKVEIPGAEEDSTSGKEAKVASEFENEENKTVVIVAQREKKGEENEDCAATHLLSDADSQANYVSLEFVGRGPLFGYAKDNDDEDSDTYTQPKKFSKPMTYYPHMSGGYVHEVPPNIQQPPVFDRNNYVNRCNYPPMSHPREKIIQSGFMPSDIPMSGQPYNFNPNFDPLDWYLDSQPSKYYDPANEYPASGNFVGSCDGFPLSQHLMQSGFDGFPEPCSPDDMYINSQLPVHSPHDQVLSSPGSSPPSFANSPYDPASLLGADCDLASMSPSSYLALSPESGIVGDLTEMSLDLQLALEFVKEHACDDDTAKKTPFLPELIETLNTVIDPIDGTVLPSCCTTCQEVTAGVSKTSVNYPKKLTRKAPRKQSAQALSPVSVGDGVQPGIAFPPPGINVNQLPQNVPIPCVFFEPVKGVKQSVRTKQRPIQPKPPPENSVSLTTVSQTSLSNVHANTLPVFIPPLSPASPVQISTVMSSSEQDQIVKAYRWVAGLQKEKLLIQDNDGDTILHLTIVKDEKKLVKALLERYVREDLIDKVINLANRQHQTPLCLAVFLNQMDIVKILIERGADVNVQLQRKLNCGLMCYRLIHYAAKRGQKWVPTLRQLLSAKNIDLHAFDSDGCTAMHCAIGDHGEIRHGSEKINSKDTIFHLAMHGADLNCQHGLSGKTPLHYAIEKKDSDLVGWFLGLAMHVQSPGARVSSNGNTPDNLLSSIINARPSGGITAVQLALNIQMDPEERVRILELLLTNGAEVSQKGCDGKLRQELGKYPKLASLLKNGTSALKNV